VRLRGGKKERGEEAKVQVGDERKVITQTSPKPPNWARKKEPVSEGKDPSYLQGAIGV